MVQVGNTVWISSPSLVRDRRVLCLEATVEMIDSDGLGYWLVGFGGLWLHRYVFPSVAEAEAAGRGFAAEIATEKAAEAAAYLALASQE